MLFLILSLSSFYQFSTFFVVIFLGDNECYVNTEQNGLKDAEDGTETHFSSLGQEGKRGCQLPNRKRRIVQFESNRKWHSATDFCYQVSKPHSNIACM